MADGFDDSRTDDSLKSATPGMLKLEVAFGSAHFSSSGDGELVLRAFEEFKKQLANTPTVQQNHIGVQEARGTRDDQTVFSGLSGEASPAGSTGTEHTTVAATVAAEPLPLFLNKRNLKGNAEIAAGIAVWASTYKRQSELDTETFQNYWRLSGRKTPSNIPRDVKTAAKEGWLEQLGSRKYILTSYGERFVNERVEEPDLKSL